MTGKELKQYVGAIPDDCPVTINGHPFAEIISVSVEYGCPEFSHADLRLTSGLSIVKDSYVEELFKKLEEVNTKLAKYTK
jgi:hypothetical protein